MDSRIQENPGARSADRAVRWQLSRFMDLTPAELYAALALRQRVFVVEQECAYQDADWRDADAWHLLGWTTDEVPARLVAYARIFEPGRRYDEGSIGRVIAAPETRGTGLGRALMVESLRCLDNLAPGGKVKIAAQQRLERFYAGLGFRTISDPYEEDRIMHVDMILP
ncbi:MAG TPA: GNAT family N-acetyltransferase [Gemmatimonadaceae bacterium]|nr:GNAT family N-acetyltransferase [Gemmatimonadaceae bacterium]